MRNARSNRPSGFLIPALFLAVFGLLAQGCAHTRAPLVYATVGDTATATVEIPKSAGEVYETGMALGKADRLLVIQKADLDEGTIWIRKGSQDAVLKTVALAPDRCRLVVGVDSGAGRSADNKRLALGTAGRVCAALGVEYAVAE
jgi:hypothetical protein